MVPGKPGYPTSPVGFRRPRRPRVRVALRAHDALRAGRGQPCGNSATSRSYSSASGTCRGSWPAWKKPALSTARLAGTASSSSLRRKSNWRLPRVAEADELPEQRQLRRLAQIALGGELVDGAAVRLEDDESGRRGAAVQVVVDDRVHGQVVAGPAHVAEPGDDPVDPALGGPPARCPSRRRCPWRRTRPAPAPSSSRWAESPSTRSARAWTLPSL